MIFLYLHKSYDALDHGSCLGIILVSIFFPRSFPSSRGNGAA